MKKIFILIVFIYFAGLSLFPLFVFAENHDHEDLQRKKKCHYCGMYLRDYTKTIITITYKKDDLAIELCSLYCAVLHMKVTGMRNYSKIEVRDFNTGDSINAEDAFWARDVINHGAMTSKAKPAFEKKADAEAYLIKNRGEILSFKRIQEVALEW